MNGEMIYFFVTETKLLADCDRKTHINYPIDTLFLITNSPSKNLNEIEHKKCISINQPSLETIINCIKERQIATQETPVILLDAEITSVDLNALFQQLSKDFQRIYFINFRPQPEFSEDFVELQPKEQEMMLFENIAEFDTEKE